MIEKMVLPMKAIVVYDLAVVAVASLDRPTIVRLAELLSESNRSPL